MQKKHHEVICFFAQAVEWQPWHKFMKGAPPNDSIPNAPECDGKFGGLVKILSAPENGDGWAFLVRHVPPQDRKVRFGSVSRSREQSYCLLGSQLSAIGKSESLEGKYSFLQADTVHGGTLSGEVIHLVHYDGAPDEVVRYEVVKQ